MDDGRHFYYFGEGSADGTGVMKNLLGGKGAGLAEMTNLGIPVPPGFTITTRVCAYFVAHQGAYPADFQEGLKAVVARLERSLDLRLGDPAAPLLVSVRSGGPFSMPGMMDTVLNLGLNDTVAEGLASLSRDRRFAFDSYRRFIQMYGDVVLGVDRAGFEQLIQARKTLRGVTTDPELSADDWADLVRLFKTRVLQETGKPFPEDPWDQLQGAISAVFRSWNNRRAVDYRKIHNIPDNLGTAVNIQAMVFGNMGSDCATGVAFTRDPNTGEGRFFGEFLVNAQGEDVVAGIRTPQSIARAEIPTGLSLQELMPAAYADLERAYRLLETHYKDMQDIEFTIQKGKLWMLQTRTGKRSPAAAVRMAVEMAEEGLIPWTEALKRVKPEDVEHLLHPTLDPSIGKAITGGRSVVEGLGWGPLSVWTDSSSRSEGARPASGVLVLPAGTTPSEEWLAAAAGFVVVGGPPAAAVITRAAARACPVLEAEPSLQVDWKNADVRSPSLHIRPGTVVTLNGVTGDLLFGKYPVVARGLPASPGVVSGAVVFNPEEATRRGETGEPVILVRQETSPEDVMGMKMSVGILTSTGGMTSHAAVVGRGMGKCCVVGCQALRIDESRGEFRVGNQLVREGDIITLHGVRGEVLLDRLETVRASADDPFLNRLLDQADLVARLKVRANADNPEDARVGRDFGAQGIGLCRTEHMFFDRERIQAVREMILAERADDADAALDKLLPYQTSDFKGIFKAMAGLPVTIRLLDPPLHEFLPHGVKEVTPVAAELGVSVEHLQERVESLREFNPMLGHRGCRLGVTHPAIYDMQVRAILTAVAELKREEGLDVIPEIMIPLVGDVREFDFFRPRIDRIAQEISGRTGVDLSYTVGTMIELPRAALCADEIARSAEFFSFGTNDLTQTTYGLSRDDLSRFAFAYHDLKIWAVDPFKSLDVAGVGKLVEMGVRLGRATRPGLKIGICGEHGGDPASIVFCQKVGLDYVSCSPFRVPVARLAAGRAALDG